VTVEPKAKGGRISRPPFLFLALFISRPFYFAPFLFRALLFRALLFRALLFRVAV